ncbi:MAG: hypothetical protein KDD53_00355 [Bdellovibrionales bacterium]|nr:hypothetical protein [Bdellovibrionales bacterium]
MVEQKINIADIRASRLLETVELMEFGVALMRQNITRMLPNSSKEAIESELQRWLFNQPDVFQLSLNNSSD